MATSLFPLSIPTFTDHRDLLDDVEAEHVNYLQREVNALARTLGVNPQVYTGAGNGSSQGSTVVTGTDYGSVVARLDRIERTLRASRPAGEVTMYLGYPNPPEGWLFLFGQTFDRNLYPDLYAANGNSTTLPDFRNRIPRGSGDGSVGGLAGASETYLSSNQIPNHTHPLWNSGMEIGGYVLPRAGDVGRNDFLNRVLLTFDFNAFPNQGTNSWTGGNLANQPQFPISLIPPVISVNFIVRAVSGL